jgi:outer membrane protein assembly factor BamB
MRMRCGLPPGFAAVLSIGLVFCGGWRTARAVEAVDLVVPQMTAERHGLTRAWFTQVPGAGGRAQVTHVVQDDGMLFVQTSSAMLFALDAETGRIVWSAQVGEANRPTLRPAANGKAAGETNENAAVDKLFDKVDASSEKEIAKRHDKVVAVVNGSTLFLLNRADGSVYTDPTNNVQWKILLPGTPEAGPLVTDDMVYIPIFNGPVQVYLISDSRRTSTMLSTSGHSEAPLVQVADRIAWATDKGVLEITQLKTVTVQHRIETTGPITARLSAFAPKIFAGSIDGYLYCVDESTGDVEWKLTVGSSIRESPVVIPEPRAGAALRGAVYAVSEDGGMFRTSMADGHQVWFNPSPRAFLAASPTRVYALDAFGHMLILNAKTGSTIDSLPMPEAVRPVLNSQTDRVLLTSDVGLLQCLHEPELAVPRNYIAPKAEQKPDAAAPPKAKPKPVVDAEKPKAAAKSAPAADAAPMPTDVPTPAPKAKAPAPKAGR